MFNPKKAKIALEDGTVFEGYSFGASGERCGEVVFNTSMAGYQEILSDPSYKGQIVVMTYPLIGNYGINCKDSESYRPFVEGFVVKEASRITSNWRSQQSLQTYLKENNILGIEGIDTRCLTKHIRTHGALRAVLSTKDFDDKSLVEKAKASPGLSGRDLVKEVSCGEPKTWNGQEQYKVAVIDCGVKFSILECLRDVGCQIVIFPYRTTAETILRFNPDGVLISNGPGDPEAVHPAIVTACNLIGKVPLFGICLGHQIFGLAMGGKTYKLKFGHHGGNHPVKDVRTGAIAITSQNHGFCVDIDSLNRDDIEITHMNLNDGTLEGMRHKKLRAFSVQFHPESAPGPHDSRYLFREFAEMMEGNNKG
jgi:carbamoyl-phosphate synthase small subunit